jgi:hypothetical protein
MPPIMCVQGSVHVAWCTKLIVGLFLKSLNHVNCSHIGNPPVLAFNVSDTHIGLFKVVYIYIVYDRMFGDFPAQKRYIHRVYVI